MIDARKMLGTIVVFICAITGCGAPARAEPAPIVAATPRADGLSAPQIATLESLKQVDDHPLYTMRYVGAYTAHAPLGSVIAGEAKQSPNRNAEIASSQNPFLATLAPYASAGVTTPAWACSLFAALGDASNMLYWRNFDWDPSPAVLLFTEPPDGYASVSMVDIAFLGFAGARANDITNLSLAERRALLRAPSLPFDGMNVRGLVVGMAAVPPGNMPRDPTKRTIGSLGVIREMLDHAATVDEAVALVQGYNIDFVGGPPVHYLVADATGRAALIEFHQGKMYVILNETAWHHATNFLRSSVEDAEGKCWRYDTLTRQLAIAWGRSTLSDAMKWLQEVSQNGTQWSIVYGMSAGEIRVTMGRHYDRAHAFQLKMGSK